MFKEEESSARAKTESSSSLHDVPNNLQDESGSRRQLRQPELQRIVMF
jgi:hypothetical protein